MLWIGGGTCGLDRLDRLTRRSHTTGMIPPMTGA